MPVSGHRRLVLNVPDLACRMRKRSAWRWMFGCEQSEHRRSGVSNACQTGASLRTRRNLLGLSTYRRTQCGLLESGTSWRSIGLDGRLNVEWGYVTVVIRGDVDAVNAASEAAKPRVEELGRLIVFHVIARPSDAALRLLGMWELLFGRLRGSELRHSGP